jgi:hypothetical protein
VADVKPDTSDPLYRELIAIGAKSKSLRPTALITYTELLACRQVATRAPGESDRAILAVHASRALRDAISTVVEASDRLVAEAALAATERFEGKRIGERQDMLAAEKKGRITLDVFKAHRRVVFGEIVLFLRTTYHETVPPDAPAAAGRLTERYGGDLGRVRSDYWDAMRHLGTFARAGLAALFVREFDALLAARKTTLPIRRADACASHMFSGFCAVAWSTRYAYVEHDGLLTEWLADKLNDAQRAERIVRAVQGILDTFFPALHFPDEYLMSAIGPLRNPQTLPLYTDLWLPWYRADVAAESLLIEDMTAKASAVAGLVYGTPYALAPGTLLDALFIVEDYYCAKPYDVVFDGISLEAFASVTFRNLADRLARLETL